MSTHNMYIYEEIEKIIPEYHEILLNRSSGKPSLSGVLSIRTHNC